MTAALEGNGFPHYVLILRKSDLDLSINRPHFWLEEHHLQIAGGLIGFSIKNLSVFG